ncbi:hypothetical protein WL27_00010 [Burkholderia multivorans]|nr:hypothetical protein WL27_00010 [Burkholderia multivorans]
MRFASDRANYQLAAFGRLFHFGDPMKNDLVASAVKVAPAVGGNFWLWLKSHDINWWVRATTLARFEVGVLPNVGPARFHDMAKHCMVIQCSAG